MGSSSDSGTHVSLLLRVQRDPTDAAAWGEFVERYGRSIYRWCRKWKLQHADAEDVTQVVLLKLAERLRDFAYDPSRSFRAWLKTLTHHAWYDYRTSRRREGQGSGDTKVQEALENTAAGDDLVAHLEKAFDQELLDEAARRVRQRVEERTWNAFQLLAVEQLAGAEVAERLHMKVATVFVARSKVQKMIREEIRRLEQGG